MYELILTKVHDSYRFILADHDLDSLWLIKQHFPIIINLDSWFTTDSMNTARFNSKLDAIFNTAMDMIS